jgi:hypothetical protein
MQNVSEREQSFPTGIDTGRTGSVDVWEVSRVYKYYKEHIERVPV